MLRIGLTGGIGSGKSTVAEIFSALGVAVIDTDEIAHSLLHPDGAAYEKVVEIFGEQVLTPDQTIDRRKLARIVFNSEDKKKLLESILHPLIWLIVEQKISLINTSYCMIAVPLLIEGKHQHRFDRILVVMTEPDQQIARVIKRDNRSEEEIKAIINNQTSDANRLQAADDVIYNNDSRKNLIKQVEKLHAAYLRLSKSCQGPDNTCH